MEIKRLLRLDRADSEGRVPIHLRVCWLGNRVRLSTGEKVLPLQWDDKKEKVREKAKFSTHINARLDIYENELKTFLYEQQNAKVIVTETMVRAEIERIRIERLGQEKKQSIAASLPAEPALPTPYEFVSRYKAEKGADRSLAWQRSVSVVGNHFNAFRPGLTWPELTLSNLNLFKVYLQQEEEVSDATLETYVGLLRGMLKYAGRSGMPVPADYTYLEVRRAGDTIQPELEHAEINLLRDAKMPHKPLSAVTREWNIDVVEQTRWYFVLACHTGLRHSDLWQLIHPRITHIEGYPCLEITQQKTKQRVPVPLTDDAFYMLKNPPLQKTPLPKDDYNPLMKYIAKTAELNRPVLVGSYYQGNLLSEQLPLHDTISSHMARRTFATMMTAGGMPTKILQELMGHTSIASTEKYTKVSNNTVVRQAIEAWGRSKLFAGA